jgi:hypothetical protein
MFAFREGSHTVSGDKQSKIPNVQIASGDQDAGIRGYPGDDRNPGTDVIKDRLQG